MKKLILIGLLILILPVFSFAETGEKLSVDGYHLDVSVSKLSSELVVRCQIKGGNSADRLFIRMGLIDTNGKTVNVGHVFKSYSYSDKFSIKKRLSNGANRWKVSWVDISN
jgi:hypothetical protein